MQHVNGHDRTPTAIAIEDLAAAGREQAALEHQQRALPLMLHQVTHQRNAALDQLALVHAELALLRAEYDRAIKQNAEHQAAIDSLRGDLAALNQTVEAAESAVSQALGAAVSTENPPEQP